MRRRPKKYVVVIERTGGAQPHKTTNPSREHEKHPTVGTEWNQVLMSLKFRQPEKIVAAL